MTGGHHAIATRVPPCNTSADHPAAASFHTCRIKERLEAVTTSAFRRSKTLARASCRNANESTGRMGKHPPSSNRRGRRHPLRPCLRGKSTPRSPGNRRRSLSRSPRISTSRWNSASQREILCVPPLPCSRMSLRALAIGTVSIIGVLIMHSKLKRRSSVTAAGFSCNRRPGSSSSRGSGQTFPSWFPASRRRPDRPRWSRRSRGSGKPRRT